MSRFEEILREANLKFTAESGKDHLEVFVVHGSGDFSDFLALVFPTTEGTPFLRLVFFLDRIRTDDPVAQYELLLELNREAWMGAYAVDPATSAVIYVFNFPMAEFDSSALVVTQETFRLSRQLYEDAMREAKSQQGEPSGSGTPPEDEAGE